MLALTIFIIFVALVFDFLNGMNDAVNSIATLVSTRVSPRLAVVWAAFFNFVAAFGFGVHVATTIGTGIVESSAVSYGMVLSTLVGAILWTYVCTRYGLPISASHSLIGGLVGAAIMKAGFAALIVSGLVKVALFIVLSPVICLVIGTALMIGVTRVFRNSSDGRVDRIFRVGQLLSAAAYSLGHGTNDAQKTMGIIAILLYTGGYLGSEFYVPFWVVLIAHAAIGLGTLVGGWKVIHTLGMRLTHLRPVGAFSAEAAAASVLVGTSLAGIPVSTTHTISGAIMGVGATRHLSAVRWGIAGRIVWAWALTIPISALVGALTYGLISLLLV